MLEVTLVDDIPLRQSRKLGRKTQGKNHHLGRGSASMVLRSGRGSGMKSRGIGGALLSLRSRHCIWTWHERFPDPTFRPL